MKKFIRNKLKSLLNFIEDNFRIKKSPPDIYFDNLAYDCFKLFEKDMKKANKKLREKLIKYTVEHLKRPFFKFYIIIYLKLKI